MLEITFSDLFLLLWAAVATGCAVYFKHHAMMRHRLIVAIMADDEVYTQMKEQFNKVKDVYERKN